MRFVQRVRRHGEEADRDERDREVQFDERPAQPPAQAADVGVVEIVRRKARIRHGDEHDVHERESPDCKGFAHPWGSGLRAWFRYTGLRSRVPDV